MKKYLFLLLVVFIHCSVVATDSTIHKIIARAFKEVRNRPSVLSEEQAIRLYVNPGVVDTIPSSRKVMPNGFFVPFINDLVVLESKVPVYYHGADWHQDTALWYQPLNVTTRYWGWILLTFLVSLILMTIVDIASLRRKMKKYYRRGNFYQATMHFEEYQTHTARYIISKEFRLAIVWIIVLGILVFVPHGGVLMSEWAFAMIALWFTILSIIAYFLKRLLRSLFVHSPSTSAAAG
jgi:hypothetical protein